jgi:hypothetical protein
MGGTAGFAPADGLLPPLPPELLPELLFELPELPEDDCDGSLMMSSQPPLVS